MATMTRQARVLGVALVVEEGDGRRTLFGLSDVREASISVEDRWPETAHGGSRRSFKPALPCIELAVTAYAGFVRYAGTGFEAPAQLPRGIYLPGMQFHALPEPGGDA